MMKGNPFESYLGPEDKLHRAIRNYIVATNKLQFFHSFDEGKRSPYERYKHSIMRGNIRRLSDFIIITPNKKFKGIVIEVKANTPFKKDGTLRADITGRLEEQSQTIELFKSYGWDGCFVWDFDQAASIINEYIDNL